jgi:hypothetical protein
MKKLFSILIAGFIISSSVHLTIATHFCCNELEAFKVSVTGEKAKCEMEPSSIDNTVENTVRHKCCSDRVAIYLVTDNYSPVALYIIKFIQNDFIILNGITSILKHISPEKVMQIAHSPPGECLPNMVKLASICIFRK